MTNSIGPTACSNIYLVGQFKTHQLDEQHNNCNNFIDCKKEKKKLNIVYAIPTLSLSPLFAPYSTCHCINNNKYLINRIENNNTNKKNEAKSYYAIIFEAERREIEYENLNKCWLNDSAFVQKAFEITKYFHTYSKPRIGAQKTYTLWRHVAYRICVCNKYSRAVVRLPA